MADNSVYSKTSGRLATLIEYYRSLIKRAIEHNDVTDKELISLIRNVTIDERFQIAKNLLNEIQPFTNLRYGMIPEVTKKFSVYFLEIFRTYDGISREDYSYLFTNAHLSLQQYIVGNPSLPVDMLIEYGASRIQDQGFFNAFLLAHIRTAQEKRAEEIWSYLRSLIPDNEGMTDEMILSVSGYYGKVYL